MSNETKMTAETINKLISDLAWRVANEGGIQSDYIEGFMNMSDEECHEMLAALGMSAGDEDPNYILYHVIDDLVAEQIDNIHG